MSTAVSGIEMTANLKNTDLGREVEEAGRNVDHRDCDWDDCKLKITDLCREVDEAGRDVDRRKRDRNVNLWLIQLTEDGFQAAHVLHLETSVLYSLKI